MKTLHNHTLLYDADCPLCATYTKGFINGKLLDTNGRQRYNSVSKDEYHYVDMNKARNEIALVDTQNNTVTYGVDSLLNILGHSMPWIAMVGYMKPIHYILKRLYSFVSYNRKVIVPSSRKQNEKNDCIPDFNRAYRLAYITLAWGVTSVILYSFAKQLTIIPSSNILTEVGIAFGQMLFQVGFILTCSTKRIWDYLGNLMTVSLMGSMLLMPLLLINSVWQLPYIVLLAWFGFTVSLMLYAHMRRVKLLKLPGYLSFTWVVYRVLVLIVILTLSM